MSGKNIEQAMEWLLAHSEDPDPVPETGASAATNDTPSDKPTGIFAAFMCLLVHVWIINPLLFLLPF